MLLVEVAAAALIWLAADTTWWALLGVVYAAPAAPAARTVLEGAKGPRLIPVLQQTGLAELLLGAGIFAGAGLGPEPAECSGPSRPGRRRTLNAC